MRKYILIIITIVFTISCKERPPTTYLDYDFIIEEKVEKKDDFYIRSTEAVVHQISIKQFIKWKVGDTIKMRIVQDGFFKGTHVIRIKD